jgi:hypothetical protein
VTAATIAVLVAALAIALPAVLTHDSTSGPVAPPAPPPAGPTVHDTSLAGIRIAVFNATPLPDLGRSVGERLRSRGAYVSIFGNGPAQPGGRTIVRYMPHEGPSARRVANALRVARVDPYDPSGPDGNPPATVRADVIVLVGYDQQP